MVGSLDPSCEISSRSRSRRNTHMNVDEAVMRLKIDDAGHGTFAARRAPRDQLSMLVAFEGNQLPVGDGDAVLERRPKRPGLDGMEAGGEEQ